jgi:hypothetical protein
LQSFIDEKLEAAGGVRQPLSKFMSTHPGLRLIEPPFMQIRQAMGTVRVAGGRPGLSPLLHRAGEGVRIRRGSPEPKWPRRRNRGFITVHSVSQAAVASDELQFQGSRSSNRFMDSQLGRR